MVYILIIFNTNASRTFYVIDQHTKEIQQAIRIRLFADMNTEELNDYQLIASHWFQDSKSHGKVTSNAAAKLGGGAMYAAGWRAGFENYLECNSNNLVSTTKVPAAYGTYAPGLNTTHNNWTQLRSTDHYVHTLYGKRFFDLLPLQFSKQQTHALHAGLPFLGRSASQPQSSTDSNDHSLFGPNITHTHNGFYNAVHADNDASDHMAFGIFFPVTADNFTLASNANGYAQLSGGFINAHYKTILDFSSIDGIVKMAWWGSTDAHCTLRPEFLNNRHTHLGTSIQVAKMLKTRVENLSKLAIESQRLIIDDATRYLLKQERRI